MTPAQIATLLAANPGRKLLNKDGSWTGRVMTPPFRLQWPVLAAPTKKEGSLGKPKYSVVAIFHPSTDLTLLRSIDEAAINEAFKNTALHASLKRPLREQVLKSHLGEKCGFGGSGLFATLGANEGYPPAIVAADGSRLPQDTLVQPGDWYVASTSAYAYGHKQNTGNRGVGFNLSGLRKIASDTMLDKGSANPADDFGPVAGAELVNALAEFQ